MAQNNDKTYFECSQRQKRPKKSDVGPRIHKKWPLSTFFYIFFRICCTISRIFVAHYFLRPCLKGLVIPVILSPRTAAYDCYYRKYGQIKAGNIGENSGFWTSKFHKIAFFIFSFIFLFWPTIIEVTLYKVG